VAACLVSKEHLRHVRCGASAAPASPRVWCEDQRHTFDEVVRRLQTESPSPNEQRSACYLRRQERTSRIGLARNTRQNCSPKAANADAGRKVPSLWTLVWREACTLSRLGAAVRSTHSALHTSNHKASKQRGQMSRLRTLAATLAALSLSLASVVAASAELTRRGPSR
jgi:hypothetical protein